jgi:two-component system, cell cycle sensor histidine kinase and response regulator CckA
MKQTVEELRAELERSERRLRAVLETAPLYVLECSPDGVIQYVNRTHEGLSIEQVVGSHLLNWLPREARPRLQAAIDAVLAGERRVELVSESTGPEGPAWYHCYLGPVEVDGELVAICVVGQDITTLRRAQIERERERQLAALGRVSASIAHDYNTLFTAMLCSLDAARMVAEEPELLREELATLETAVNGAAQLTRHLNRVSRPDAPSADRCDLSAGLRELAPLLERVAGRGIALQLEIAPGPLYAALHGTDLSQLMLNLVINSREAMPDGGKVLVSLAVEDGAAGAARHALLRVADTGPGIPDNVMEHMFDPYFSTKERGSGFGLATCYGIAASAGGEIRAARASSGGALIELRLPLYRAEGSISEPPPPPRAGRTCGTLLLIDDNPELRATLRRHLSRAGYTVLVGCDAADALEVARRHPGRVDLVISDVVMPGGSGISLLRTLREERPDTRALAITGHAPERELGWLREHAVPVLRKPFSVRDLERRIRELLR